MSEGCHEGMEYENSHAGQQIVLIGDNVLNEAHSNHQGYDYKKALSPVNKNRPRLKHV